MRNLLKFTAAAAPLALLAACGSDEPTDDVTDVAAAPATSTDAGMTEPGPATRLSDAGDYSGTYNYANSDGTTSSLSLNSSDNTYEYTGSDGSPRTGTYTVDDDGYRLTIDDYNGSPGYFAISNGALYRLQNDTAIDADTMVSGERYTRDGMDGSTNNSAMGTNPSNTMADEEQFSREPELGSPVAPPAND
ncbi:hypothetical protein [Aurantiacibacter spongiae]|uniref:Lipoprotein n=1 Tax=Aurantiacibacter spongiae TaxID=2488860 RepID=A0A3N5CRA4_9SPHN|nr:hypothetical protein [Aurantiacibacter spongiae]RPF71604.1 hypothetical protein EG799_08205 [Aurantiacibacter spongiae]